MERAKDPNLQQTDPLKTSNQEQVEYAKGKPSRFLPGVSIVGQPAIQTKLGGKGKHVPQGVSFMGQQIRQPQSFTAPSWQSQPADRFDNVSHTQLPLAYSLQQEKAIPSLYQPFLPTDSQGQPESGSLLAQIAHQICGGT
ncbi:MAG: hypothetical protein C5B53_06565 [Candidatus Melainabacteria bacterium]|nr:MAG: hypothetical protein C5B53_06565 [Candidatus Melainabacteria bacterium]